MFQWKRLILHKNVLKQRCRGLYFLELVSLAYCATTEKCKKSNAAVTKNSFFCFIYQKIFFYFNNVDGKVVQIPKIYKINKEVFFLRPNASTLGGIFQGVLKNCNFCQIIYESNILNSI